MSCPVGQHRRPVVTVYESRVYTLDAGEVEVKRGTQLLFKVSCADCYIRTYEWQSGYGSKIPKWARIAADEVVTHRKEKETQNG